MNTNRFFFVMLILIAVPLYIYDALLIFKSPTSKSVLSEIISESDVTIDAIRIVHYVKKGKNPFLAYKVKPRSKVAKVQKKVIKRKPKKAVKPPRIKITGIMWNPTTPVAMLTLPNGTSTMAKKGDVLMGAIEVKRVNKSNIVVIYKDVKFTINK